MGVGSGGEMTATAATMSLASGEPPINFAAHQLRAGNLAGARDDFEQMLAMLLAAIYPSRTARMSGDTSTTPTPKCPRCRRRHSGYRCMILILPATPLWSRPCSCGNCARPGTSRWGAAKREYFNADLLAREILDKRVPAEVEALSEADGVVHGIWESRFNAAVQTLAGNPRLPGLHADVMREIREPAPFPARPRAGTRHRRVP